MKNVIFAPIAATLLSGAALLPLTMPYTADAAQSPFSVHMGMTKIDGVTIAYREAGDPTDPTVLLLHGFPTSSHMFRDLIPVLAEDYHIIAPDYPGFGASDMPDAAEYDYSFANTATIITKLLDQKKVDRLCRLPDGLWCACWVPHVHRVPRTGHRFHHSKRQRL